MIANFFNKSKPVNIFSIITLLLMYFFISIFLTNSSEFSIHFLIERTVLFSCYVLFLFIFKFIVDKNKLTEDNLFSLFLVVILVGTFSEALFLNYIIFSNLILLLSFRKIYSLRSGINTKIKLFDAAIWVGISTLIFSWSIFYLLLIYIGILMYQKVSLKNLMIPIIGFLTPIFLYFTYNFYVDDLASFYSRFNYEINVNFEAYNSNRFLIPIAFTTIILGWSIIGVTPKIVLVSNRLKSSWIVLLCQLLISTIIVLVSPIKNGAELFYLAFPIAIIIANFLQRNNSIILNNLILYLFLIISASVYFL
ncbi:MAG: hypothetical protein COB01_01300 [Lutibacter sp.]|nr:MAG: hypothetical protein COB01_01300 [Lutibacter sp.]